MQHGTKERGSRRVDRIALGLGGNSVASLARRSNAARWYFYPDAARDKVDGAFAGRLVK